MIIKVLLLVANLTCGGFWLSLCLRFETAPLAGTSGRECNESHRRRI